MPRVARHQCSLPSATAGGTLAPGWQASYTEFSLVSVHRGEAGRPRRTPAPRCRSAGCLAARVLGLPGRLRDGAAHPSASPASSCGTRGGPKPRPPTHQSEGSPRVVGRDMTRVWLLGVVDYHGSRLVALDRVQWPTSAEGGTGVERGFAKHGKPTRVLTDNGGAFITDTTSVFLGGAGVRHRASAQATRGPTAASRGSSALEVHRLHLHLALRLAPAGGRVMQGLRPVLQPRPPSLRLWRSHTRRGLLRTQATDDASG